jgi:hypothetical protein
VYFIATTRRQNNSFTTKEEKELARPEEALRN